MVWYLILRHCGQMKYPLVRIDMNHYLTIQALNKDEHTAARDGLSQLQRSPTFDALVAVLKDELVAERNAYELNVASEFQRGQVAMLKKVINMMEGTPNE